MPQMGISQFVIDGLAVYRGTRLVTTDAITGSARDRIVDRGGLAAEGIECDWCVGLWLAAGAAVVAWKWPEAWRVGSRLLAVSVVVGVISKGLDRLE